MQKRLKKQKGANKKTKKLLFLAPIVLLLFLVSYQKLIPALLSPPSVSYQELLPQELPSGITDEIFSNKEYLSRPTKDSITVSLIPVENIDAYVEYGTSPNNYPYRTNIIYNHPANESLEIVLNNLNESTRYFYRLRARKAGYENYEPLEEYNFTTPKKQGEEFTFIIGADSHVVQLVLAQRLCGACRKRLKETNKILKRVKNEPSDFFIDLGDTSMTHIYAYGDPARTQEEAYYRYGLARNYLENLSASKPVFFVLGNHDGETGFTGARHHVNLTNISTKARLKYIPNPTNKTYPQGGGEYENYYSFEWGDVLFIILDPFRYTNIGGSAPTHPNQWTLGPEQLIWLNNTIRNSNRTWKFIFSHHLVGGTFGGSKSPYSAYGDGGVDYANIFEQAIIQDLMEQYNGHFFYGHTHLFAHGISNDVNYILTSSYGANLGGYFRQYLFKNENPISAFGYTKVHVTPNNFTFQYINGSDGNILYQHTTYESSYKHTEAIPS